MRHPIQHKAILIAFMLFSAVLTVRSQEIKIKEGDTLRLKSNGNLSQSATITITVPKDGDNSGKTAIDQSKILNGKVTVTVNKDKSHINLEDIRLPITSEFKLDNLKKEKEIKYSFSVPRDKNDDGALAIDIKVLNSAGTEIISKPIIIYVKPIDKDSLTSGKDFELWFMTGTNFDLFNGARPQEFFFRANTLFKINKDFYGQIAFYKNRYFTTDTVGGTLPFTAVKRPSLGDTLYTLTAASFRQSTKQTIDPLALQFDILYKLTHEEESESNFFITAGFDFSTTSVNIENKYQYSDTTFYLRTSKPDTVRGYNNFGTTSFPEKVSYKKPAYNLNVGFMWILDQKEVNVKAHLTAGMSNFTNLINFYQSRGAGIVYNYESKKEPYLQLRMFATYKPLGLSFGMESFIVKAGVPAFNFTLSKAFDIKGFIKNFTPVSGLKISD